MTDCTTWCRHYTEKPFFLGAAGSLGSLLVLHEQQRKYEAALFYITYNEGKSLCIHAQLHCCFFSPNIVHPVTKKSWNQSRTHLHKRVQPTALTLANAKWCASKQQSQTDHVQLLKHIHKMPKYMQHLPEKLIHLCQKKSFRKQQAMKCKHLINCSFSSPNVNLKTARGWSCTE